MVSEGLYARAAHANAYREILFFQLQIELFKLDRYVVPRFFLLFTVENVSNIASSRNTRVLIATI